MLTWASSDAFVATVSQNGEVRGQHAGTATITATNAEGRKATAKVTVLPQNDNFNIPCLSWGANANQVKSATESAISGLVYREDLSETTPDADGFTTSVFMTGAYLPSYSYVFGNGKLANSTITITLDQDMEGDLEGFLQDRYKMYGETETEAFYMNADELSKATMKIVLDYIGVADENPTISATWMENPDYAGSRAAGNVDAAAAFNKARAAVKGVKATL